MPVKAAIFVNDHHGGIFAFAGRPGDVSTHGALYAGVINVLGVQVVVGGFAGGSTARFQQREEGEGGGHAAGEQGKPLQKVFSGKGFVGVLVVQVDDLLIHSAGYFALM